MSLPYREILRCRICGGEELAPVLSLGVQALTGVFPRSKSEAVIAGPVDLVKCAERPNGKTCGLVQLRQSYDRKAMFANNRYGYRSGLNASMALHLQRRVQRLLSLVLLSPDDTVIDIGSNDGTLLKAYPAETPLQLIGVDPSAEQFRSYYPPRARLLSDFFPSPKLRAELGQRKAKIITSIAMFYDLEDPQEFAREAADLLDEDGIWCFEQSYLPEMMKKNAYDAICHEHLEYYALRQILWLLERAGLKIIDLEFNEANGGSFCVTSAKRSAPYPEKTNLIKNVLEGEAVYSELGPFACFKAAVARHREEFRGFLLEQKKKGAATAGYGASTKGNVILQYCGITEKELPKIGEVNEDKFGAYTPGTGIPIVPEKQVRDEKPDYLVVLPWHFRDFFVKKEQAYLRAGGRLYFPLPKPEIVG